MTTGKVDSRYGNASVAAPPWKDIERVLADAQLYWIITVRRDGHPHAVPLVGVWHDGAFAFCTGSEEQKQRNLDANPTSRSRPAPPVHTAGATARTLSSRARRCA
jgi:hypothetical protein